MQCAPLVGTAISQQLCVNLNDFRKSEDLPYDDISRRVRRKDALVTREMAPDSGEEKTQADSKFDRMELNTFGVPHSYESVKRFGHATTSQGRSEAHLPAAFHSPLQAEGPRPYEILFGMRQYSSEHGDHAVIRGNEDASAEFQ